MTAITEQHIDVLKELINIGAGKGADILNSFLNSHVELSIPDVTILTYDELNKELTDNTASSLSSVEMKFTGPIDGAAELIFLSSDASRVVELITGSHDPEEDFDAIKAATFSEVGNIVINAVVGTLSNELAFRLQFSIPNYLEGTIKELLSILEDQNTEVILFAKINFFIKEIEIDGNIALFFSLHSFNALLGAIDTYVTAS